MQPIYLFPDALTREQTQHLWHTAEARGFQATGAAYPPSYRDNDRHVVDDPTLAGWLFERIGHLLPETVTDESGAVWSLRRLNPRFRFCRYRDGQSFGIHRDGVYHEGRNARSMLTFMVYLNDADEFEGGQTRFYRGRDTASGTLSSVTPARGALVVFDHALWHDGAPVTTGTKMVMRSDVIYECRESTTQTPTSGHLGYIWQVLALSDGGLASAGRDGTVRRWRVCADGLEEHSVRSIPGGSVTALVESRPGEIWAGDRQGVLRVGSDTLGRGWEREIQAHDGAILALERLATGQVASAGADGTIAIWAIDGEHGTRTNTLRGHAGWVWSLSGRSDGALISGGEDGTVRIWSPTSGHCTATLDAGAPVRAVLATRDWRVVAGDADGFMTRWDGLELRARNKAHSGAIRTLAENPSSRELASGGEDDRIHIWSLDHLLHRATREHADFVTSLTALADGRWVSASYDSQIAIWPRATQGAPARAVSRP